MEQIEEAVRCALDPSSDRAVKAQATQYCESVKTSAEGWQVCLELFTNVPERIPEARMFALQVIDAMIVKAGVRGSESGASERLGAARKTLLGFVSTQYAGPKYQSEIPFLKNKLAHTITMLALASYPTQWPSFVSDMISMAGLPSVSGPLTEDSASAVNMAAVKPSLVDFMLKVFGALDEEMVNPTVPRGSEELARNTDIKDAMRVNDVNQMAYVWYAILAHMSSSYPELAKSTLRLIGVYVSWIDINLIVNQPYMRILYELLKSPVLRTQACHCLTQIVGKGMRPMDKLLLLQFISVIDILKQLDADDVEFAEEVGKLVNVAAVELKGIWVDKDSTTPDARSTAYAMLEQLMPLILSLLAHEYDEVSSSVFTAISEIMNVFKKMHRDNVALSESQQDFLSRLLPTLVGKLKYSDDYNWPSTYDSKAGDGDGSLDEDDDEAMFIELRRSLRVFIDAIGQVAPKLYDSVMLTTAQNIFKQCSQYGVSAERATDQGGEGQGQLGWVRAELGIYLTQAYGERLSSNKGLRFGGPKYAGQANGQNSNGAPVSTASIDSLSDLLTMMIQSGIASCSHPAIAPMYFENFVRFNGYFDVRREAVTPVFTAFLGPTGIRHPNSVILQDPRSLLQIHHYLTAIGSIVKGFPDVRVDAKVAAASSPHQLSSSTSQVFLKAADMCIVILETLQASQLIREAARFTLSRMLSVLGAEALPYMPRLIDGLVTSCAVEELSDLLGFLGLIVFKFKPDVAPTASKLLLPVISKVYGFLDQVAQDGATGTDEAVLLIELRKAYLTWVVAIFNSDLDSIFLTPQNAPHLVTIFRPIATQLATDPSNPQCQRLAFNIMFKAIQAWMVDPKGWHTLATMTPAGIAALTSKGTPASASGQDSGRLFMRQITAKRLELDLESAVVREARSQFRDLVSKSVVSTCFEATTHPEFRITDAQASMVVTEVAGVLQMLLMAGMPEIAEGDGSAVAAMNAPQILTPPIGGDLNRNQFASYLCTGLLPSLGCPTAMATEFVQALASLDQKQFKKYLAAFISNSSSSSGGGSSGSRGSN
ncbi:pre-tRNA nuclear export protein [Coemansia interrupta]|uniref:Exportin-T n=1 Tax=Coemansia interrupta TaxID=1126814 RepID=A0A9W8H7Z2_9FUNG|nr:pre-tRNA nuclear export protein [Coemansia interrupta]